MKLRILILFGAFATFAFLAGCSQPADNSAASDPSGANSAMAKTEKEGAANPAATENQGN